MKKGLLSLLVVALTVVGCQDYDDQFDSLNKTIVALQADVTTMKGITTAITALDTQLKALEGKVLQDGDLADITSQIGVIQKAINDIPLPPDVSDIETQVTGLNDEIDAIILALGKLTKAGQTYAGDINIRNLAELEIAETAFGIDPAVTDLDPMGMNITGSVLITAEATSLIATDAIKARLQVVMNSIKSAGVNLTVTGIDAASSLPALSFVGGNATFEGTSTLGLGALTSVIGTVHFDLAGAIVYPLLASAASVQISQASTVTSVDLSGLITGNVFTTVNNLVLPNATSVKVAGIPPTVTCALATTFEDVSATAIGTVTPTTITLAAATTVDLAAASIANTTIAANLANVTLSAATSIGTSTLHASALNADLVASADNANTISATTISLAALAAVPGDLIVKGLAAFSAPALATMAGTFTSADVTHFDAPLLVTDGLIDLKDASPITISLKSIGAAGVANPALDIADWALVNTLTLAAQPAEVTVTALTKLENITYGGDPATITTNDLFLTTANASITTVVLTNEMRIFSVVSTTLTTLSTAGVVLDFRANDNDLLTSIDFGHTFKNGESATIVTVQDNALLPSIDMSSLEKCKAIAIQRNPLLTSIIPPTVTANMPSTTANIQINFDNNKLSGTYTAQVDATDTSEVVLHTATSVDITAMKVYIDAMTAITNTAAASITYNLDVDLCDDDADGVATQPLSHYNPGGAVNTAAELSLF